MKIKSAASETLRWILVLPVALLSYGISAIVIFYMVMCCGNIMAFADNASFSSDGHLYIIATWISKLTIAWVAPMAFVMVGSLTAPRAKVFVAFLLIMLHAVVYAFVIGMCAVGPRQEDNLNQIILVGLVGAVSTLVAGFYQMKQETPTS